jgi:hypothetical protein
MAPHGDRALPEMAYGATHHRLFPHPFVGWRTPHRIAGLALVPARCDRCVKERGDEIVAYRFTLDAPPATGAGSQERRPHSLAERVVAWTMVSERDSWP